MMPNNENIVIFDEMTLSDLFRTIYNQSQEQRTEIRKQILDIASLMDNVTAATLLGPILVSFTEASIANDDQLIKIASIVQRLASSELKATTDNDSGVLTEAEKKQLLTNVKEEVAKIDTEVKSLAAKTVDVLKQNETSSNK